MTDVLERLRADNPVDDGAPPSFEEVWGRIDRESGSRRARSRQARTLAWGAAAVLPAALVATIALVTLGDRRASTGSGGAPAGSVLLHYHVQSTFVPNSGSGFAYEITARDIWVSGRSIHNAVTSRYFSGGRLIRETRRESVTNGRRLETFSAGSSDPTGQLVESPARTGGSSCGPFFSPVALGDLGEFCGAGFRDPAAALRQMYDLGELTLVVRNTGLPAQPLDELKLPYPGWVVDIFVKHGTFIPVDVFAHHGPVTVNAATSKQITATVSDYQRLPLTPSNRRLMQMRPHPGARVICTGGAGAVPTFMTPCSALGAPMPEPPPPVRIVAQVNLSSPNHRRSPVGIAEIVRGADNRDGVAIAAQGVAPNPPHTAYAVWLTGGRRPLLLGFMSPRVGSDGRLRTTGALPADTPSYRFLIITLERNFTPRRPGIVVLRGVLPRWRR